jgi:hypothetical protein
MAVPLLAVHMLVRHEIPLSGRISRVGILIAVLFPPNCICGNLDERVADSAMYKDPWFSDVCGY